MDLEVTARRVRATRRVAPVMLEVRMLGLAGRRREARCAIVILLKCGGPPILARGSVQVEVKLGEASDSLGKGQLNIRVFIMV